MFSNILVNVLSSFIVIVLQALSVFGRRALKGEFKLKPLLRKAYYALGYVAVAVPLLASGVYRTFVWFLHFGRGFMSGELFVLFIALALAYAVMTVATVRDMLAFAREEGWAEAAAGSPPLILSGVDAANRSSR